MLGYPTAQQCATKFGEICGVDCAPWKNVPTVFPAVALLSLPAGYHSPAAHASQITAFSRAIFL